MSSLFMLSKKHNLRPGATEYIVMKMVLDAYPFFTHQE